jgi:hypothetical protein
MQLHNSVQTFLREYLLNPLYRTSKEVQSIHLKAIAYLSDVCTERESRLLFLEKLIEDDDWKESKLALIHHTFWLNSENGWKVFVPAFVAGLLFDVGFARACLEIIDSIFDILRKPEKQRFEVIKRGLNNTVRGDDRLVMLDRLHKINESLVGDLFQREVLACLSVLQGRILDLKKYYSASFEKYLVCEANISEENEKIKLKLGEDLYKLARSIYKANLSLKDKWSQMKLLEIVEKAITYMSAKERGYATLGSCLTRFHRYDEAFIALN